MFPPTRTITERPEKLDQAESTGLTPRVLFQCAVKPRSRRQLTGARGSGAFIQVEFNLWWQQLYFEMNSPAQRGEWALLHHQTIEGSPTRTKVWKLGSFHELGDKFAYIRRAQYSMNSSAFNSFLSSEMCHRWGSVFESSDEQRMRYPGNIFCVSVFVCPGAFINLSSIGIGNGSFY